MTFITCLYILYSFLNLTSVNQFKYLWLCYFSYPSVKVLDTFWLVQVLIYVFN